MKSVKVSEFGETTSAIVEVYQKVVEPSQKTFFDVVCASECVEGSTRYLSPLVRISSTNHLAVAIMEAMLYISERHKEIREAKAPASEGSESLQRVVRFLDDAESFKQTIATKYETIKEFKSGSVICELLVSEEGGSQVFSVCCWREFSNGGARVRDFFIQQRDLRNLVIALMRARIYFQEHWGSSTPVDARRW